MRTILHVLYACHLRCCILYTVWQMWNDLTVYPLSSGFWLRSFDCVYCRCTTEFHNCLLAEWNVRLKHETTANVFYFKCLIHVDTSHLQILATRITFIHVVDEILYANCIFIHLSFNIYSHLMNIFQMFYWCTKY